MESANATITAVAAAATAAATAAPNATSNITSTVSIIVEPSDIASITMLETIADIVFGLAFLVTAVVSAKRMAFSRQQQLQGVGGGAETTVVTAFYSLICATGVLRSIWFLIPRKVWQPSYTPIAVYAFDSTTKSWLGAALSEIVVTAGSLTLFSIFILILVYWADILKKYFHPGSRRMLPMLAFFGLVSTLLGLEIVNILMFLTSIYTTEGMILFNAILLAIVSMVCVCEITIFSHRFRTVLKTLGAINQVSTDAQVKRIVWITVTGNLFFLSRAFLESVFSVSLLLYFHKEHTVAKAFSHFWWDIYEFLKYASEVTILGLMLYILQTRFTGQAQAAAAGGADTPAASAPATAPVSTPTKTDQVGQGGGYSKVPDTEPAYTAVV